MREWISIDNKICGNEDCSDHADDNKILQTCGTKLLMNNKDMIVPITRACPNCNTLIDHIEACKHMKCSGCGEEFCFMCLSMKVGDNWLCV